MTGERPERPKDPILTDGLWGLTKRCLEENPRRRPEIAEVISYLRTLASREDCRDAADVTTVDGTTLGSTRECVLLYGGFTSINPFEIMLTRFKDVCCPTHAYQFWRRCKSEKSPPENGPASDTHDCAQTTAPGSRSLLRRAVFWLLNCGMPSAQDLQDDIPVQFTEHRPHNLENASEGENSTVDRSRPGSYQEGQCWPR